MNKVLMLTLVLLLAFSSLVYGAPEEDITKFNLRIEGQEILTYGSDIIYLAEAIVSSPVNSLEQGTNRHMTVTLTISGNLRAESSSANSETVKLFKWAQVPGDKHEAYRKVTLYVENVPERTIILDKAFVLDYTERYNSTGRIGTFYLVIRQKADAIDDVTIESSPAPNEVPI